MCIWSRFVFKTFTEAETFPPGVVGLVVWVLFLVKSTVWGQTVTIYTFPHSGNVYMVTVCFETLTEKETLLAGVVGRVVWGSLFEI